MNLYLVTRTDDVNYDEYDSQLVRAESEERARQLCCSAGEGRRPWRETANVVLVTNDGEEGIIIASFQAG